TIDNNERQRQREQFAQVWETAQRGPDNAWRKFAPGLESYPLFPYLELAALQRRLGQLKTPEVAAFLKAWPDSLPAALLRDAFLGDLARRQDWKNFVALYDGDATHSRELRCAALQARLALGGKLDFSADVEPLWLSAGALPDACDDAVRWAKAQGKLSAALI